MSVISLRGKARATTVNTERSTRVVYRQSARFACKPIELVILSQRDQSLGYFIGVHVDGEQMIHLMHEAGTTPVVAYRALLILSHVLRRGLAPTMNLDEALVHRCLMAASADLDPTNADAQAAIGWAVAWVTAQQYYWVRNLGRQNLPDSIRAFCRECRSTGRPRSHRA